MLKKYDYNYKLITVCIFECLKSNFSPEIIDCDCAWLVGLHGILHSMLLLTQSNPKCV